MHWKIGILCAILFACVFSDSCAQTVYKTATGKKFHQKDHYPNSTAISIDEALKLGLEPCLVCKPNVAEPIGENLAQNADSQIVYKTETGKKYHTAGHYASSSPLSLADALRLGLGPCAICQPGINQSGRGESNNRAHDGPADSKIKASPVSTQCKGTTKAGARCKRVTTDPSGYCYQHVN